MDRKELESALEAILFASGEPVQVDRICVALDIDRPTVEQLLQKLMDYYAYERRGIRLLKIDDSWQLCSAPDYAEAIRKAFEIRKPAKLSQPAAVIVSASSHLTAQDGWQDARGMTVDNTVNLVNREETLPKTGDVSAVVFVVAGSILIGAICALILELIFRTAKRRIRR